MKSSLVESRRKQLENFCKSVSEIPYLYESTEFQIFCRGSRNYEEAKVEFVEPSLSEIRVSYEILFGHMPSDPPIGWLKPEDVPIFESKLASIYQYCLHLRKELKKTKAISRAFSSEMTRLNFYFQRYFHTNYTANTSNPLPKSLNVAHWPQDESFTPLEDWVKSEQIAIEYMLDTLRSRQEIKKRLETLTMHLDTLQNHYSALQTGKKSLVDRISSLRSRAANPLDVLKAEIITVSPNSDWGTDQRPEHDCSTR